jgi:hypothetical protein
MITADVWPRASREPNDCAKVLAEAEAAFNGGHGEAARSNVDPRMDQESIIASQVADIVTGIEAIGKACNALKRAGLRATIAGNRISVNEKVFVQYIGAGAVGGRCAAWIIYASATIPPIWTTAVIRAESSVSA